MGNRLSKIYTRTGDKGMTSLGNREGVSKDDLPALKDFILPAGSLACSHAHVCRTMSRTAERAMVSLYNRDQNITENAMQYINRLSDWFFIFSRVVSRLDGGQEVLWNRKKS